MERNLFTPLEYVEAENTKPVVFLAGPIQDAPDWQNSATNIINSLNKNIIVASPRILYKPGEFDYEKQVNWESHHLKRAAQNGAIIFWLAKQVSLSPDRAYAQTTRAELFEWKERHIQSSSILALGIEDGFSGERYIRLRFGQDCPDIKIMNTLEETCKTALEQINLRNQ